MRALKQLTQHCRCMGDEVTTQAHEGIETTSESMTPADIAA